MLIDFHCHIYPDAIAEKATQSVGRFYDFEAHGDGRVDTLLQKGAAAGVDHFVVHSVATVPAQVSHINRFIAQSCADAKGRFTGFGTLHPQSPDLRERTQEIVQLGLRGIKVHPDFQQFRLDSDEAVAIARLACEYGLFLLIHTGDYRYDYSNPNRLIPLLRAVPGARIIAAHFGGWSMWEEAAKRLSPFENLLVDCSSATPFTDARTIRRCIEYYGAGRVLYGSDFPLADPAEELARFRALQLARGVEEQILWKNAAALLELETAGRDDGE